jgi:tripartite-type tricarboxylate transporter receptor subunit TctC
MKKITLLLGLFGVLIPSLLTAQQYPTKPINLLVVVAPGGVVDTSIRIIASKAEKFLGQPFIVSNNAGGAGSVGLGITAKERPDGYHLVGCSSVSLILMPHLRPVPYKLEDFVPIMHFAPLYTGLVVRADSPWKTLKDLVEYARKNPGKVTYSTAGVGFPSHLAMEYIAKQEGIEWTNIPYTGGAPALTALLGSHVSANSSATEFSPHVKQGTLRLLASHGEKRMKNFPDAPTLRELGYDFVNENVFMIAAPKGTPSSIVKRLDDAFFSATKDPEFLQTLSNIETDLLYRNSTEMKKYLEDANTRLGKMVAEFNIPKEK